MNAANTSSAAICITGAARRIGLGFTERLLRDGWRVLALVRQVSPQLHALQQRHPGALALLTHDLEHAPCDSDFWNGLTQRYGAVAAFVHCASRFEYDTAATSTSIERERHHAIHVRAFVDAAVGYYQCEQTSPGALFVALIDQKVRRFNPDHFSYTLSKLCLDAVVPYLALTLAPKVRVNAISPGFTLPNPGQSQAEFEHYRRRLPLGHGSTLDDLYAALQFFLSAKSVTGQNLVIDAGQHLLGGRDPAVDMTSP